MLFALLTACAKTEQPASTQSTQKTEENQKSETVSNVPSAQETQNDPIEPDEIVFYIINRNGSSSDAFQRVEDAINELTVPQINVKVHMVGFQFGEYMQMMPLAIAGGEQVDLACTIPFGGASFPALVASSYLMDISPYQDLMPTIQEKVGEFLGMYTVGDKLLGFPLYRVYGSKEFCIMSKPMLEEVGMVEQAENADSFSDLEAIFEAIKERYSDENIYASCGFAVDGLYWTGDRFDSVVLPEHVGDTTEAVVADKDGHVSCVYAEPDYTKKLQMVADWAQKGYVHPDAAFTEEDLMKSGVAFSQIAYSEIGVEGNRKALLGYDVICPVLASKLLTSTEIVSIAHVVPVTAEEPEAAVRFANMMYESGDLVNLLAWGIEGEDYVINDLGEATFPAGKDDSTADLYHNADYLAGNQFLIAPWEGSGEGFREMAERSVAETPRSAFLGFALDTSDLANNIAAITAVQDEYKKTLGAGGYNEQMYQAFLDKLQAAGVDAYCQAIEDQLQAYLANQ